MMAVIACGAPAAPDSAAQVHRDPLAFLPAPSHGRVDHLADRRDAPVVPVVACDVSGPQEGLSVPSVDVKSKGLFDRFVIVFFVRTVSISAERWVCRAASHCWRTGQI